jgi:hypothetical protein
VIGELESLGEDSSASRGRDALRKRSPISE